MTKEQFEDKAFKEPNTGCWLWPGKSPYGPTRKAYKAFKGPIPDGLWVLHKCDTPPCINPDHLWLGTRQDNMIDCLKKGRIFTYGLAVEKKKTHCPAGHEYSQENTSYDYYKAINRKCKKCAKARMDRYRARLKAQRMLAYGEESSK